MACTHFGKNPIRFNEHGFASSVKMAAQAVVGDQDGPMPNYPEPGRSSIRLRGFDYTRNAVYFLTLCTAGRRCLFGNVDDGLMILNPIGELVEREWLNSALVRAELDLHSFVVMPNHLHALITFSPIDEPTSSVGARGARPLADQRVSINGTPLVPGQGARHAPLRAVPRSLSSFVGGFKAVTTRQFRAMTGETGSLWQRGFYEHIVRDDREFARIGGYIANNPSTWALDQENLDVIASMNDVRL